MNFDLNKISLAKLDSYREPIRKGTAKGDPIGLSRKKYKACLMCLMKIDLRTVAEAAGVSYGVLLKWRTEDVFKKMLKSESEEVAGIILTLVTKHAETDFKDELKISAYWSDEVQKAILGMLPTYFSKVIKRFGNDSCMSAKILGVLRVLFSERGDDQVKLDHLFNAIMWLATADILRMYESMCKLQRGEDETAFSETAFLMYSENIKMLNY